jgi:hypothetical protein
MAAEAGEGAFDVLFSVAVPKQEFEVFEVGGAGCLRSAPPGYRRYARGPHVHGTQEGPGRALIEPVERFEPNTAAVSVPGEVSETRPRPNGRRGLRGRLIRGLQPISVQIVRATSVNAAATRQRARASMAAGSGLGGEQRREALHSPVHGDVAERNGRPEKGLPATRTRRPVGVSRGFEPASHEHRLRFFVNVRVHASGVSANISKRRGPRCTSRTRTCRLCQLVFCAVGPRPLFGVDLCEGARVRRIARFESVLAHVLLDHAGNVDAREGFPGARIR